MTSVVCRLRNDISLIGEVSGEVVKFRRIPYADPPIMNRKWRVARRPFLGFEPFDTRTEGPICPQPPSRLEHLMGKITRPQDDDSLSLSITAPARWFSPGNRLPVVVWLHGGANVSGAGNLDWYDGEKLAFEGNLIFVAVNYRLGPFGYLRCPRFCRENIAFRDQVEALRWVKEFIQCFGGDPSRVTVLGQSAGANAAVYMMCRRESKGLFSRAFLMSPSLGRGCLRESDAARVTQALLTELGCGTAGVRGVIDAARRKSTPEVFAAAARVQERMGKEFNGMIFNTADDLTADPSDLIKLAAQGAAETGKRIVLTSVRDEALAFGGGPGGNSRGELERMQRDLFDGPAEEFARELDRAGVWTRRLRLDWSPAGSPYGACHCIDLPLLFGTFETWNPPMLSGGDPRVMQRLGEAMRRELAFFSHGEKVFPDLPDEIRLIPPPKSP